MEIPCIKNRPYRYSYMNWSLDQECDRAKLVVFDRYTGPIYVQKLWTKKLGLKGRAKFRDCQQTEKRGSKGRIKFKKLLS